MLKDPTRFDRAIARFDALNAEDPNRELADGREYPKELLYAERMSAMLQRYAPEASESLRLAARCQHIQRWKISRSSYPMTRPGYHQWRKELRNFHAATASAVLHEVGYDAETIAQVSSLIRKEDLPANREAQTLEDVVVLVFVESYLEQFIHDHQDYDEAKFMDILRKTSRKMSPHGMTALASLPLPPALAAIVQKLLNETEPEQAGSAQ